MAIKAVEVIFKLKDLFSTQVTKVTGAFRRTESASGRSTATIRRNNKQAAKSFGGLTRGISSVTTKLLALASATLVFVGLKRSIEGVIKTGSKFEDLAVQMEAVTGSAEAGEKAFEWVKEFTKETPFQLEQVAESFVKLRAFGLDPMDGSMQAIADQAAKLGGSQETLNGIVIAVGQAWAKQKLQGEEILQLVERGVPVWELLSKATGKNVKELNKLSAAGKLGRTEITLLIQEIGKASDGAAAKAMGTMTGLVSNLADEWTEFKNTVAEAGVFEFAKEQVELLKSKISEMAKNGELQELANNISNAMIGIAQGFKSAAKFIVTYADELKTAAAIMIAMKIAAFGKAILGVGTAFIAAARGIRIFKVALISTGIGAIVVALGELTAAAYEWLTASKETSSSTEKQAKHYGDLEKAERKARAEKELDAKAQEKANEITKQAYKQGQEQLEQVDKTGSAFREKAQAIVDAALAEENATKASTKNQIKALADYEKALDQAKQKTLSIADEFNQLTNEMQAVQEVPGEDLSVIDFAQSLTNAQQALNAGDYNGAIEGARETAAMLRKMKEEGNETGLVLTGLSQQLSRLANDAAKGSESNIPLADTPIITPMQIDTAEAMRQLQALRAEAAKPITVKITTINVSESGNSFTDRNQTGFNDLSKEALKRGTRR